MSFFVFADVHPFAAIILAAIFAGTILGAIMCVCDAIVRMIGED